MLTPPLLQSLRGGIVSVHILCQRGLPVIPITAVTTAQIHLFHVFQLILECQPLIGRRKTLTTDGLIDERLVELLPSLQVNLARMTNADQNGNSSAKDALVVSRHIREDHVLVAAVCQENRHYFGERILANESRRESPQSMGDATRRLEYERTEQNIPLFQSS